MDKHQEMMKEASVNHNGPKLGQRHIQAFLLFLGITAEIMTRFSLTVSIVAMTDNSTSTNPEIPTYNWSNTNVILSSFYWGYMVFQVLLGQLAKTYGAKWLFFGTMSINATTTMIIPLAAEWFGSEGVMACRIMQGLSQGGMFPFCQTMLGRWAPKSERSRMNTFVYTGFNFGQLISLLLTGFISQSKLGWPVSFYIFGGCAFVWSAVWLCFGHSSPATHPYITSEEREYIEVSLNQENDTQVIRTPWKAMLTSRHFWSIIIPTFGSAYGNIILQVEIPTYLEKAMKYDVASSGSLASLGAAAGMLASFAFGPISDYIIEKRYLSSLNARKAFEIFACFGCAGSLLILAFLNESQTHVSVVFLTLSSIFSAAMLYGHGVNSIDLSPRFSGIILAFSNSFSCVAALVAPLSVQFMVTDETNTTQWRAVFILASLSFLVPSILFVLFASAERQWWDDGADGKVESSDLQKQKQGNNDTK